MKNLWLLFFLPFLFVGLTCTSSTIRFQKADNEENLSSEQEVHKVAPWKQIEIGTKKPADLRQAITAKRMVINCPLTKDKLKVASKKVNVDLFIVSVNDISPTRPLSLRELLLKLKQLGFQVCNQEIAFQLRSSYEEQEAGDKIFVTSEPVTSPDSNKVIIYSLENNDERLSVNENAINETEKSLFGPTKWVVTNKRY